MGKAPADQFYWQDWSRDLEEHPLEIEGAWIRLCCKLWWSDTRGEAEKTAEQWGRILRVEREKAEEILNYIKNEKIGDVTFGNKKVTVACRRMVRNEKKRKATRDRVARHRENQKQGCNAECNTDVTPPSSSSSSSSVHNNNIPHQKLLSLWSEKMPELIQPRDWDESDKSLLRARWNQNEKYQSIEWWSKFFDYMRESKFLMGEVDPQSGNRRFKLRLQWILKKSNFKKIIEGVYHE